MHGAGNDFVVFDARTQALTLPKMQLEAIAQRRTGIGCDQIIVVELSQKADAFMRIYNADGSQGTQRLMFAVNPHTDDTTEPIGEYAIWDWQLLADHECFYAEGTSPGLRVQPEGVFIPGLGCSLWISG